MKNQEWNKARRTLKKAARIDKTNTTTLRFLREVDEQTGVTTKMEKRRKGLFGNEKNENDNISGEIVVRPSSYKERSKISLFFTTVLGFAAGAAAFWLLVLPAVKQDIYRQANQQIIQYSDSLSSQSVELTKAQGEAAQSSDTADAVAKQAEEEQKRSQSYEALFNAYTAMQQEDLDTAALELQKVYVDTLSDSAKGIYSTISGKTGVSGIESGASGGTSSADSSMEQLKLERMPQLRREKMHRALTEIPEKTAATVTEEMRIPLTMEVIQNKKDHNSYRGETSDKGNVRWRIPLFLPFGHEKWNKKSKMGE